MNAVPFWNPRFRASVSSLISAVSYRRQKKSVFQDKEKEEKGGQIGMDTLCG